MTRHLRTALAFVAACGTSIALSAQTPSQPQTPPRPQTTPPATRTDAPKTPTTTIVGCLKAEKDVPGLAPDVVERAGIGEDYVLTNVRVGSTSTSGATTGAAGTSSATGTTTGGSTAGAMGSGLMYKIDGIDRDELKKHVNHEVELQGHVDDDDTMMPSGRTSTTPDTSGTAGTRQAKPKEFEATSLRMVSASCPGSSD